MAIINVAMAVIDRVFTNNEMSSASPIDSERDTDAGDFLLMGGIVCLLLGAYTLLKRF